MIGLGDIVVVEFPGARATKRRPAIVLSTATYHASRPDVILGLLTSRVRDATAPTDYLLQDWSAGGLHRPSAFRAFLATLPAATVTVIGHMSARDWAETQRRLHVALALT